MLYIYVFLYIKYNSIQFNQGQGLADRTISVNSIILFYLIIYIFINFIIYRLFNRIYLRFMVFNMLNEL